jgi:hypothetical protein
MRGGDVDCDNIKDKCKWLNDVQLFTGKPVVNGQDFICGENAVNQVNIKKEQGKIQTFIDTLSKSSPLDDNKLSNAQELLEKGQAYINCMSQNSASVGAEQTIQDENDARLAEEQKILAEEAERQKLAEAEKVAADKLAADKLAAAAAKRQQDAAKRQQDAANKEAAAKEKQKAAKEKQKAAKENQTLAKKQQENTEKNQIENICEKLPDNSARPSSGDINSNYYNDFVYDIKDLPNLYNIDINETFYKATTDNVTITKIKVTKELFNRIQPLCGRKIEYFYTPKQSAGRRHKKYTKKRR